MNRNLCIIIAAKDAQATIAGAVASAMRQAEVGTVVVVDDGSSDETADRAVQAAPGDNRLKVIRLPSNMGPSYARNRAIAASGEPFIAMLDADDEFLDGRFARLFAHDDWDMIADDIAFVSDPLMPAERQGSGRVMALGATAFVLGNISRPGVSRGEFGFLKPVLRRSFLERNGLLYDDSIRLGEDYDLYMRMLLAGAEFKLVDNCGYRALMRPDSLSGKHRTADLRRLVEVDSRLLGHQPLDAALRAALLRHQQQLTVRFRHRQFLETRRSEGLAPALRQLGADPRLWGSVALAIGRDKLQGRQQGPSVDGPRYLLTTFNSTS